VGVGGMGVEVGAGAVAVGGMAVGGLVGAGGVSGVPQAVSRANRIRTIQPGLMCIFPPETMFEASSASGND